MTLPPNLQNSKCPPKLSPQWNLHLTTRTSMRLLPAWQIGTLKVFECYSNAHDVDPSNGHSTIHNLVVKAFQSSLASYAKETGPCKTQEDLTAACCAMAGFHNSRHKRTKIWVSQPDASYGSVVSTGVTVADSLPDWVTHCPIYKVHIYQGQSKPDSQK